MHKFERITYLGCPWLFGVVLIIVGIYLTFNMPGKLQGLIICGFGLICMSLYCVCALLAKIIDK